MPHYTVHGKNRQKAPGQGQPPRNLLGNIRAFV